MESHFLMRSPAFMMILLLLHWAVLATFPAAASEAAAQDVANAAPLVFDGKQLFLLRGVTSYPAQRRAEFVHAKITEAADDESVSVDELAIVDSADRTGIYAGKLLGLSGEGWTLCGVDPEGADLIREGVLARLPFDKPVSDAEGARVELVRLVKRARQQAA